ncbi:hypothetical protein Ae168Ps1_0946c [Pseudonocardia sp. Ae168_Ps1]|nr:hypothetical protein Ae150APs1_0946c [Pseudonocardia sp. Ae150A_Ps1]OLL78540.1 hypothetical protein Ae168Ps1_0946c [Pseudonocardia sp. Ae168_Ps1]OLL87334.1 hypothetical protein Ae263Ps1_4389 [Pseudonocardia sp. Ae263_Ps1]OLL92636.1 hypothetical protein Ae356Ps1_2533c [Pseudonocardia sp. Ae356_Ps1]
MTVARAHDRHRRAGARPGSAAVTLGHVTGAGENDVNRRSRARDRV